MHSPACRACVRLDSQFGWRRAASSTDVRDLLFANFNRMSRIRPRHPEACLTIYIVSRYIQPGMEGPSGARSLETGTKLCEGG